MILSLYNKQFLLKNEPRFIYTKIQEVFNNLKIDSFIFPEVFEDRKDETTIYTYLQNSKNFNNLKIQNAFFKPNLLLSKIDLNHIVYLDNLNTIYNNFYYDLNFYSTYNSFINNKYSNSEDNYFKFVFNSEDKNSYCYKRSPILNVVAYKFIKPFVSKYVNHIKFELFDKISKINKDILLNSFNSYIDLNPAAISEDISNIIIKKILKLNNYSNDYFLHIKYLISSNLEKIKIVFNNYANKILNSYYFINLNSTIIENLTEHITYTILNYPVDIFHFVNKETVLTDFIIDNFSNNAFDFNNDNVIDDIWDPDDDNDFVNVLRRLNPALDEYYKSFFVVQDNNPPLDNGGYLSHINILENQIFQFIRSNINNRENETNSIFYIAAQFSETSSLHYINSLIYSINSYITDIVSSDLYNEINNTYLPDRVLNLLIKNIYIDKEKVNSFFSNINFNKSVLTSKAIELSVYTSTTKLIHNFFDSDDFNNFLFNDFFTSSYLKTAESRFPRVRDDLINNLNNFKNSLKFVFSSYIYDRNISNELVNKYYEIYNTATPLLTIDDITDIYENYLNSSSLVIDEYRELLKNIMISYSYSLYLNIFLDGFRLEKKFSIE